ncbi:GNAT family N-acetyltransferase [Enterococcus faecium]|uniref:GNAT family N-acetyltransferase n=1 Tax=Enterococcus faecium TaxID=1352 RepID=UPI003F4C571D
MKLLFIDDNMVFDIDNLKGFLNDTSSFGFIAKENNKIIGFAYCYTLLRPDGKTMFYLHSIGMLPNYQDKGYGSKLLSFIKEYSKEIGCSEMFLITDKGNPGFESIPRTRFVRIFSRFQRVSISSFRPAVKPKPFDR